MASTTGDKSRSRRNGILQRIVGKTDQDSFSVENDSNAQVLPDERLIELQAKLDMMRGQVEAILTSINEHGLK